jgi:hypothetical protein
VALNAAEECEHLNQLLFSDRAELWGGTKLEEPTSDRPPAKSANSPVGGFRGEISEIPAFSQRAPSNRAEPRPRDGATPQMATRTPRWGHPPNGCPNGSESNQVGAARSFATRSIRQIGTRMRMALNAVEECEHLNHTPISVRAELWGGTKLGELTSERPPAKSANTPVGGLRGEFSEIQAFSQRAPTRERQANMLNPSLGWCHPPNGSESNQVGATRSLRPGSPAGLAPG